MPKHLLNKKLIFNLVLTAFTFLSQAQSWQWAKRAGSFGDNTFTTGEEQITDIKVDKLGNIYATGYFYANPSFNNGEIFGPTTPNGFGLSDAYLIKYSACGKTLWIRRMGGNGYDEAHALVLDDNGQITVSTISSNGFNNIKFGDGVHDTLVAYNPNFQYLVKFDTAGKFKEVKNYPGAYNKLLKNSVGDYIITNGLTAVKINTLGASTFTYNFVSPTPYTPDIAGIAIDKYDNIYLVGSFDNTVNIGPGTFLMPTASTLVANTNAGNSLIMKFASNGNMLWYKRGNSNTSDGLLSCTIDTSGTKIAIGGGAWNGYTLFSHYINTGVGTVGTVFMLLDAATGNLLSAKTGTADYQGYITPVYTDRDNNFMCTGAINGFLAFNSTSYTAVGTPGNRQNCIGKFDAAGNFMYINLLPQVGTIGGNERITSLAVSEQGNVYIGGRFGGTLDSAGTAVNIIGGQQDGFTAKYGFACNSSSTTLTPLAPTNLVATPIGTTVANHITWVDNANYETSYQLWAIGGSITSYSLIATLAANTTTYNHTGLQVNTNYCYKARAINSIGPSIYTNIGCAITGSTTSINQLTVLADFNVYPNPTNGAVTLQFVSTGTRVDVQVMNNLGQLVLAQTLQTTIGENSHVLNLPKEKGLYIVRLSTGTAMLVKKVIVE